MKKRFLFLVTFLTLCWASHVFADELLIKLKSGNTLKIKFFGQIQGVEMVGGNDAIENFSIINQPTQSAPQTSYQQSATDVKDKKGESVKKEQEPVKQEASPQKMGEKDAKKAESGQDKIRVRIAPPKFGED